MSKKLSDDVGRPCFQVCMVVDRTNQNIRRIHSRKINSYPMRTRHVMLIETDDNY